ncbi:hypothetical protein KC19_1G045400 [Ceratodon purpureus]|uniref:TIR domain-containing protein n=1 Tax=Ceratodon purpureus TaxID=3225 RepID=A0A8T0J2D9_CERPU|nr:hypothetical protein KC19_1G045400 [Ceratodon purpureus]
MESDVRPPERLHVTEDEFGVYDVFISHRGPDTKTGFVSFLYKGLEAAGLVPFLDCKSIDKGQDAWKCIDHAIKTTPIALVIFSKSFVQSEWCMKELHLALSNPGVKVLPVFYRIQPCEVNFPEKGQLATGFEKLKQRHDETLIEQWREDLRKASKLNGWELKEGDQRLEGDLVKEIVGKIFELANKALPLSIGDHVIGVDRVAQEIIQKLDDNKSIVMLGLWGMGGIGKSTLARELYNRLSKRFGRSCFIADATDKVTKGGVVQVQNCIMNDLCTNEVKKIKDKFKGKTILEDRLSKRQILLVLDDVRDIDDMEYWISDKILMEGSMCIVTSRDRRVFEMSSSLDMDHQVHIHHVQGLSSVDSRHVFASYAFGGLLKVKQGFEELVSKITHACGGVPLLLKVCGSLLKNEENINIWHEVMMKLNRGTIMDRDKIFKSLRISYDSLQGHQREMFLDIACALLGESKDMAIHIWNSRGWSGALDVRSLVEKALVTVDDWGCFSMHDLLRDLGREIERKERARAGVIRRLWMPESLLLLKADGELPTSLHTLIIHNIHAHGMEWSPLDLDVSHMKNLEVLICGSGIKMISFIPRNLSWFVGSMDGHLKVPQNSKLLILNLQGSRIETLCESIGNASNLEVLDLCDTPSLSQLPNSFGGLQNLRDLNLAWSGIQSLLKAFGELNNLEVLNMRGCLDLNSLPHSFGSLNKLRDINLQGSLIQRLPESFGELSSLEVLNMAGCSNISSLPHSIGNLKKLWNINLAYSGIQDLPESFGELSNLKVLNMTKCSELTFLPHSFGSLNKLYDINLEGSGIQSLPESFRELSSVEVLNMTKCARLTSLPNSFGSRNKLRDINLKGSGIQGLPESFGELSDLEVLSMENCSQLRSLPQTFGSLNKLRDINLAYSGIQGLPESFGQLRNLEVLNLEKCARLTSLPHSFGSLNKLRDINLKGSGIQSLPESFGELSSLEVLSLEKCSRLCSLPRTFWSLTKLRNINFRESRIQSLAESFEELSNVEVINLEKCFWLSSFPRSLEGLEKLQEINLANSGIQDLPESFGELSDLEVLSMENCSQLSSLPQTFGSLKKLRDINLANSGIQGLPESFGELSNLEALNMTKCARLTSLPHSFGSLNKLRDINLANSGIQDLPESFGQLSSLEVLNMTKCTRLTLLPHSLGSLNKLYDINLEGLGIQGLPESFGELRNLVKLNLSSCKELIIFPNSLWQLINLNFLNLERSAVETLLQSCGDLSRFEASNMSGKLILLSNLSEILKHGRELHLAHLLLKSLPDSFGELSNLEVLSLRRCRNLTLLPNSFGSLFNLKDLDLSFSTKLVSLPSSFGRLSNLEKLNLWRCEKLTGLPDSFGSLRNLKTLLLGTTGVERLPDSFGELSNLQELDLSCCNLSALPQSFTQLRNLQTLDLQWCSASRSFKSFRLMMPGHCKVKLSGWES